MSDFIFRNVSRGELLTVLTERQVEVIDSNLEAFRDDLRVSMLHDFVGEEQPHGGYWHKTRGHVFLHVIDHHVDGTCNTYRYATDLGFYEDCDPVLSLVQQYIFAKQTAQ